MTSPPPAVSVQGVSMSYWQPWHGMCGKDRNVLEDVDLAVKPATICCILGPSGCGKTALLRCIVGQVSLNSGTILIFGQTTGTKESGIPGRRVGYMPQDISLIPDLKVGETLTFYGGLHDMSSSQLKVKITFYTALLELPPLDKFVDTLSGGQQRRLSLAIALINDAELIILDEPTVGVDPIIRKRVLDHLMQLTSSSGQTILVTTHYIEEAVMAHSVAMMYDGHILCDAPPGDIIERLACTSLEAAFVKLCLRHDEEQPHVSQSGKEETITNTELNVEIQVSAPPPQMTSTSSAYACFKTPKFSHIRAITESNLRKLYRSAGDFLIHLIAPCIIMTVYRMTFGGFPRNISVGVFDEDEEDLGKLYLTHVDSSKVALKDFSSYEEGYAAVRNGDTWGLVHVYPNFTTSLVNRFLWEPDAANASIRGSSIVLAMDLLCQPVSIAIHEALIEAFLKFGKEMFSSMGWEPSISSLPIMFNYEVFSLDKDGLMGFATPGLILCGLYFLAVANCILSISGMKRILMRYRVAGITELEMLCGMLAAYSVGVFLEAVSFMVFAFGILELTCNGSLSLVFLLVFFHGICGMAFGLFVSVLSSSELTATSLGFGSVLHSVCLSGVVWPVESIPAWLRTICQILPQTYVVDALRAVMRRGWGPSHLVVMYGLIGNVIWIFVFFVLAVVLLKCKGI